MQQLSRLNPLIDKVMAGDTDELLSLSRMMTDAMTKYRSLAIFSVGDADFEMMKQSLLSIMIKLTAHADAEISESTFRFWSKFSEEFYYSSNGDADLCKKLKEQLKAPLLQLIKRLLHLFRYSDDFDTLPADKKDSFRYEYRYRLSDVMQDMCELTEGREALLVCAGQLKEDLAQWAALGMPGERGRKEGRRRRRGTRDERERREGGGMTGMALCSEGATAAAKGTSCFG